MKRLHFLLRVLFTLLMCNHALASNPTSVTWEDLDVRPTPSWWSDAKFGIFIHWGIYSVPAYAANGEYAEWYWKALTDPSRKDHDQVRHFHETQYGADTPYASFADSFRAELFDPEQWARLFKASGARYIVLTSKHHDGFALWPSAEASSSWGRPWNAVDSGPKRDLVGELAKSVRASGLKFGIYFSLYEWFHPSYLNDPSSFVESHLIPQFQDVVQRYSPSVIFSDGEWDHPSNLWRSTELLHWLFTQSASASDVVINDRWGKETRHRHGGYFTTEYGSGLSDATHPWEENRGIGHSYGFNRAENLADYSSSKELILMLADIVSRGGNFLLNVGPTADGRIPVIMQQRLTDIGEWLHTNGECIYGTTPWTHSSQWSAGRVQEPKRGQYKSGYNILKLTIDPDPGMAVKELMFTRKGKDLFAICPLLPKSSLRIQGLRAHSSSRVFLLGHSQELHWQVVGNDTVIELPSLDFSRMGGQASYVFKIEGALE